MARYTINIGNDFPLGDDHEPPHGPGHNSGHREDWRWGRRGIRSHTLLRVLFLLAIAAIVITHPIKTAILVGIVLVLRRAPWAAEIRARIREAFQRAWPEAAQRIEAWRAQRWSRTERTAAPPPDREDDDHRGYRGFV